jgi:hypothetical protein
MNEGKGCIVELSEHHCELICWPDAHSTQGGVSVIKQQVHQGRT